MTAPPPLTPPESDLRDFQFMPLDVVRLAQSDLVAFAPPEAIVAAILLWGASWHQTPAGSLTDDDRALANLAGYGRGISDFLKIKAEAMRGFVKCSDGRLYHPVVAEKVRAAWDGKVKQRWRTYCAAVRQHNLRHADDQRQAPSFEAWLDAEQPTTIRGARKAAQQEELPLDPARVTRDTGDESRVTRGVSHAGVTLQNGSKGEGQGEREGEGDSIVSSSRGADPWPGDLLDATNKLASLAGVSIIMPRSLARAMDVVKGWTAEGIDFPGIIVPVIQRHLLDRPDQPVTSLAYFDSAIRKAIALNTAEDAKGRTRSKPSGPAAKLNGRDSDDARIAEIRAKLNGKPEHSPDVIALSLVEWSDDGTGWTLLVTARSAFAASRVDRDILSAAATAVLSPHHVDVEVRTQ